MPGVSGERFMQERMIAIQLDRKVGPNRREAEP
jgi:hypothetical protein